jgi:pilus assembly protein CpaE
MADRKIRVAIVDDIADTRENVHKLLEFEPDMEVVATGANGVEAIDLFAAHQPDVLVMCINMPVMDGIVATQSILAIHPGARILMFSVQAGSDYVVKALQAGARGYVIKLSSPGSRVEDLTHAIRRLAGDVAGGAITTRPSSRTPPPR